MATGLWLGLLWSSPGETQRTAPSVTRDPQPQIWLRSGPDGAEVTSLLIDKNQTSHLYMTSASSGAFESIDGGTSWNLIRKNQQNEVANGIALDDFTGTLFVGTTIGVSRSTDGGKTWIDTHVPVADSYTRVVSVVADPSQPCTLLALAGELYKTSDCGASWSVLSRDAYGDTLLMDPTDPKILYQPESYGIYRSVNGGFNWSEQSKGLGDRNVQSLAIDPVTPSILYATTTDFFCQTFKSIDHGTNWSQVCLTDDLERIVSVVGASAGVVYAATDSQGLFRSPDGGKRWSAANAGLGPPVGLFSPQFIPPLCRPQLIVADPVSPATVYLSPYGAGIFKSTDAGSTWASASAGTASSQISGFAVGPSSPDVIYAATGLAGLFRSGNGGRTWTPLHPGTVDARINSVAVDFTNPSVIYAATQKGHVFKSIDSGKTFGDASAGLPNSAISNLLTDPQNPQTLYAVAAPILPVKNWPGGVYKSTDGGASWNRAAGAINGALPITALVMSPSSSSLLYLATYGAGVYRSSNGGGSWTSIGASIQRPYVRSLAVDPAAANKLYVGVGIGAQPVWKTTNSGLTWSPTGDGLPDDCWVVSLQVDPLDSRTVYAGTELHGIYRSTDSGGSWAPFNAGAETANVTSLAVHPLGSDRVYAGSVGNGVLRLPVGGGVHEVPPR